MVEADEKLVSDASAAQGRREQPYAECAGRRPPYFGEREPVNSSLEAAFQGESGLRADAMRAATVPLDGAPPLTGDVWLKAAAERLRARPDCPYQVTQAARHLEPEMHEAFLRRQCDEEWVWAAIKNKLRDWELWPRRRPPRRPR